jgi:hypothetical protein
MPTSQRCLPSSRNAFGDVFLQAVDGSFAFLDTLEGNLERNWTDAKGLQAAINTPDGQGQYLMSHLVVAATDAGLVPGPGEILSFKIAPVLGGAVEIANLEVSDFVVAIDIAGQTLRHVASLPPGTPVSDIVID